ncbi:phosphotransferase [Clostridium sp. 19966]|uniref:phosphotransferase n=1 Tax=Clostridium sp. 19966 TaxID=2768166 RepID=UPI0028DE27A3|nr:phosphotransferase [Clostridium sp. 19966]MDT8717517.1 phosphotransferase [Clostridium sp. 19966]
MIELNKLKLIAKGGQADIYELDKGRVIRVLRNRHEEEQLKTEMSVMNSLREKGKAVPEVYEYLKIDERPALIMEKLNGISMLEAITKKPLYILKQAEKLAKLHMETSDSAEGLELISINARAAYLIKNSSLFSEDIKKFILDILEKMPEENDICHGDFHPGNIIIMGDKYYVIDWFGATKGKKLSDIAHTYIILRNTPEIPGISNLQRFIIASSVGMISKRYLSTCYKLEAFDYGELSRWMVIRAAERVVYGEKFEKYALIKFIERCMKAKAKEINEEAWWKLL